MRQNSKDRHQIDKFTVFKEMLLGIFRQKEKYDDILIIGEKKFIEKTACAIDLLKERDYKAYKLVNNYIDGVSLKGNFPYMSVKHVTKICFVGKEIAFGVKEYYASLLAQQAYYLYLYEKIKRENPKLRHVPEELWYKGIAKRQALEFRKSVLKNINASEDLIEDVNRQIEQVKF